jgi:hypothetical protein
MIDQWKSEQLRDRSPRLKCVHVIAMDDGTSSSICAGNCGSAYKPPEVIRKWVPIGRRLIAGNYSEALSARFICDRSWRWTYDNAVHAMKSSEGVAQPEPRHMATADVRAEKRHDDERRAAAVVLHLETHLVSLAAVLCACPWERSQHANRRVA